MSIKISTSNGLKECLAAGTVIGSQHEGFRLELTEELESLTFVVEFVSDRIDHKTRIETESLDETTAKFTVINLGPGISLGPVDIGSLNQRRLSAALTFNNPGYPVVDLTYSFWLG